MLSNGIFAIFATQNATLRSKIADPELAVLLYLELSESVTT